MNFKINLSLYSKLVFLFTVFGFVISAPASKRLSSAGSSSLGSPKAKSPFSCDAIFALGSLGASSYESNSRKQIESLYEQAFSKIHKKNMPLTRVIERLTSSPAHQRLWGEWLEAKKNLEQIQRERGSNHLLESDPYTNKIWEAAEAAVNKHFPLFFTRLDHLAIESENSRQDLARFLEILKAIQKLGPELAKPDLYKIQKLIIERYDLGQFIECR